MHIKKILTEVVAWCHHLKKQPKEGTIMSENTNNNNPAQPIYIMQPQQNDTNILNGLGGIVLSTLAGLLLGQLGGGIGFPRLPKL